MLVIQAVENQHRYANILLFNNIIITLQASVFYELRGEKLNYKSVAKEILKPPFFSLLKSSGHRSLPCLFDSRFL